MSFYQNIQTLNCSNCGASGHTFRMCVEPVSSYGVLVFRWVSNDPTWSPFTDLCKDDALSNGINNIVPQILMIQRKDSLGFMDIMRGKYKVSEPDYIRKQIRGMTRVERDKLLTMEFEDIWHQLWGSDTESSQRYAHDRIVSRQKLAELRAGVESPNGIYTLADLLRQEPLMYETPEWGFPKGRRDPYETDIQCAFRELEEETSILEEELWKATNISPFIEQFYGSNNIHYRHSYYLAQYIGQRDITFNALNQEMAREIGNLAWKSLDEALILLRPENVEKRGILIQIASLLRNFYPIFRDKITSKRLDSGDENKIEEQQERHVFIGASQGERVDGRMERPKRFFGTRQTYRRVPDVRGTHPSTNAEEFNYRGAVTGDRGVTVPGYKRRTISIEALDETGVQGVTPI